MTEVPRKRTRAVRRRTQVVTMLEIGRHAGVSLSTVSRVLNNTLPVAPEKRAAVLNAVETLGYSPYVIAQELASGHSRAIGVLPEAISNLFQSLMLKGIELGLRGSGHYPLFVSGEQPAEEARALHTLLSHRIEGLIVVGGHIPDDDLVRLAERVPVLALGRTIRGLEARCVRFDNHEGARKAVRHLVGLGHARIAHITGRPWHPDAIARRQGYADALAEAGIGYDPALLVEGDFQEQSGFRAAEALLAAGTPFTAIFAGNDQMALGAGLALLRRELRVPRDVSIVGVDDLPSTAYTWPPLTTVRQPAVEMGLAAARALLDELSGRGFLLPTFDAELVLRDSTAPPPGARPR